MSLDTSLTAHYEAIALLWNAYFGTRDADRPLGPLDVGHMIALIELDRAQRFGDYSQLGQIVASTSMISSQAPKSLTGNGERRSSLEEVRHRQSLRQQAAATAAEGGDRPGGDRSSEKSLGS